MRPDDPSWAKTTLGGYGTFTQQALVPILLYKSIFLGDWFGQLTALEREDGVRSALEKLSRDTLREMLDVLSVMKHFDEAQGSPEDREEFLATLQRRVLHDLMKVKEGSTEVVVLAAMRAPTESVRERLLALADLDRVHADALRVLLGAREVRESLQAPEKAEPPALPLGVYAAGARSGTLTDRLRVHIDAMARREDTPRRLILSPAAYRHLRDEGAVQDDATALGLPVHVDFGWEGEAFTIESGSRVSLSEILTAMRVPDPNDMTEGAKGEP